MSSRPRPTWPTACTTPAPASRPGWATRPRATWTSPLTPPVPAPWTWGRRSSPRTTSVASALTRRSTRPPSPSRTPVCSPPGLWTWGQPLPSAAPARTSSSRSIRSTQPGSTPSRSGRASPTWPATP